MVTLRRSPTGWWTMIPVALWRNYLFPIPPCNGPLGHVRRSTGNRLELTPACRPSDPQNGVPKPPIWRSQTPDLGCEVLFGSHSGLHSAAHSCCRHSGEPSFSLVPWWPLYGAYRPGGQRRLLYCWQSSAIRFWDPIWDLFEVPNHVTSRSGGPDFGSGLPD